MNSQYKLLPSLWDRLLDDYPQQSHESASKRLCSLADYKASVVRDLETLVNTRQALVATELGRFAQLKKSILAYGMPDFTSKSVLDPQDRLLIQNQLESVIRLGDRRFSRVKVKLLAQQASRRVLTFHVDAVLRLQEVSRRVSFEAVLQVNTQEYKVQNLI